MKIVVAVHVEGAQAVAAAVAFEAWDAAEATKTYVSRIAQVEKPERGALDLRELPCVMQLLREHQLTPELIVIEGFVHLDGDDTPGLGRHLFQALGEQVAVVGVSKKRLPGLSARPSARMRSGATRRATSSSRTVLARSSDRCQLDG